MITRDGGPVQLPAHSLGEHEVICVRHNLAFHRPLGRCPECTDEDR